VCYLVFTRVFAYMRAQASLMNCFQFADIYHRHLPIGHAKHPIYPNATSSADPKDRAIIDKRRQLLGTWGINANPVSRLTRADQKKEHYLGLHPKSSNLGFHMGFQMGFQMGLHPRSSKKAHHGMCLANSNSSFLADS